MPVTLFRQPNNLELKKARSEEGPFQVQTANQVAGFFQK
jgi:hypothetical protein